MLSNLDPRLREALERDDPEFKRAVMATIPWLPDRPEFAAWRTQGKILAVSWQGEDVYPGFQFDDQQRPLHVIAELLDILRRDAGRSDWQNLAWFVGANGWLGGSSPSECLSDPARVLNAAEMEVMPAEY